MDRYKTRERSQVPQRINLMDPGTGELTEDWLDIRSSLSNQFIEARDTAMQNIAEVGAEPDKEKRKELVKNHQLNMKASLVAGWGGPSFDGVPFTQEAVVNFLREAPQVAQMVTTIADDGARFFGQPSSGSANGPKKK